MANLKIDGFPRSRRTGSAMIVDAEKGLAIISRTVIPFDLGVLTLTFAESIIIPGKVFLTLMMLMIGGIPPSNFRRYLHLMGSQTTV